MVAILAMAVAAAALAPASAPADHPSAAAKKKKKKPGLNLGALPLGDGAVSTAPRRGFIWACGPGGGQGAPGGPWIHGSTWSLLEKPVVDGSIGWPGDLLIVRTGAIRRITSNGLPLSHSTGDFPIRPGTTAFQYDPMSRAAIDPARIELSLPSTPRRITPSCVGGEVGILTTGVPLFTGFDAGHFDAPAHEMQDHCSGHPNNAGYHYHSLPACISTGKKGRHSKLIGYALDGFPLVGPLGEDGEYMRNDDLDGCHGHRHEIRLDGRERRSYHYHVTQQFPYSVGCFRGAPAARVVISG
jgi:hypothetical protein